MPRTTAVVLAGGFARRFGADKLEAELADGTLLQRVVGELPGGWSVVVVGPERSLGRAVRFVRERPPGGGPAAAIVCGLIEALAAGADEIVVLPGDTPAASAAARVLVERLRSGAAEAFVAIAADGREQPLQLALRPRAAGDLIAAAGPARGAGASARVLLHALSPAAAPVVLTAEQTFDIDTRGQLAAWRARDSPPATSILTTVAERRAGRGSDAPLVLALDGPSGSGTSTLAAALALRTPTVVVAGDDFYAGPAGAPQSLTDTAAVAVLFDWARLRREAVEPLAAGRSATYVPHAWVPNERPPAPRTLRPAPLVVIEGVYAARPELADLVDVAVLVETEPAVRDARFGARGDDPALRTLWERAEAHYFSTVRSPESFDLRVSGGDVS